MCQTAKTLVRVWFWKKSKRWSWNSEETSNVTLTLHQVSHVLKAWKQTRSPPTDHDTSTWLPSICCAPLWWTHFNGSLSLVTRTYVLGGGGKGRAPIHQHCGGGGSGREKRVFVCSFSLERTAFLERTSATSLTVTPRTFQVASLCLQNHTLHGSHRERWGHAPKKPSCLQSGHWPKLEPCRRSTAVIKPGTTKCRPGQSDGSLQAKQLRQRPERASVQEKWSSVGGWGGLFLEQVQR